MYNIPKCLQKEHVFKIKMVQSDVTVLLLQVQKNIAWMKENLKTLTKPSNLNMRCCVGLYSAASSYMLLQDLERVTNFEIDPERLTKSILPLVPIKFWEMLYSEYD